jgi:hypothetical protein
MKQNVLGICGREGVGKTTIANILTGGPLHEFRHITSPVAYMSEILFGDVDGIWGMSKTMQNELVRDIIKSNVDSDWFEKHPEGESYRVPYTTFSPEKQWIEFSMATPLKQICSLIFDIDYDILLAQTPENRVIREQMSCKNDYNKLPNVPFNGRVCLEYFGTDVMRNMFDNDIWLKILQRNAAKAIVDGYRVVIPDIRFENEMKMIDALNGTLFVVYRNVGELILTEDDKKTHPAKWHFLQYYPNSKNYEMFCNPGTMDALVKLLD